MEWQPRHVGPGGFLYDGNFLVGQVAEFSRTARPGTTEYVGVFYRGFLSGQRVTDDCATYDEACREVERAATDASRARASTDRP